MKVAIVHDDLVQWGGAERVLEAICEVFPEAPIYTSVFDNKNSEISERFKNKKIHLSFLQKIPGWKNLYKALLPLYPLAFEQFDFSEYDLVISHTTRFAKSIITKPGTIHISYCHTPPRFLWHLSEEKFPAILANYLGFLRLYDGITSKRVDYFLAGSLNAKARIKKIYNKKSNVLYPFVDIKRFENQEPFNGGYYLVVSRLNKYKRVDLAINACGQLRKNLKIIGIGPEMENLKKLIRSYSGIELIGNLDDESVVNVLSGCKGLIVSGVEDFGMTPLEAQALGKPVIALRSGGALETVNENTGVFFEKQNIEELKIAIMKLESKRIDPEKCKENAQFFRKEKFLSSLKQNVAQLL